MRDDQLNEAWIVRYLLGDLPEDDQVEFEERVFRDQQQVRNVQAVEEDLIDEYVRGGLSQAERRQFESRFLVSAERRRKVEFARALAAVGPEFVAPDFVTREQVFPQAIGRTQRAWRDALADFVRVLAPGARVALAAAGAALVIGGSWLLIQTFRLSAQLQSDREARQHQEQTLEQQLAGERERSEALASQLDGERQQREQTEQLLSQLERERELKAEPLQPAVVSLALLSGIPRGSSARPKLTLEQSTRLVRLQIGIDPGEDYQNFQVELDTHAGRRIWTKAKLTPRTTRIGRTIVVNLPAKILEAGEYELALKGTAAGGAIEDIGYYYFDVVRK